jgi:hypothetical protein
MLIKITRAVGAAATLPLHALAAARAAMALRFGHDYDRSLRDDEELLDEVCRPSEAPLIRRRVVASPTACGNGKMPHH